MSDSGIAEAMCVFGLSGRDFNVDSVSDRLGIPGSRVWRQRRKELSERFDLANLSYRVQSDWVAFEVLDDPLSDFLKQLQPFGERIRTVARDMTLRSWVECRVRILEIRPALSVSAQTISILHELGVELSLDIIDLRELE